MEKIVIGVDPHKLSATIEVVDHRERVLAAGRFATDKAGYAAMRMHVASWPERTWAVEGSNGAGRPLAQRLLAEGEHVIDVPAKLAARVRMHDTGHGRKTDAHDGHSVAVAAVRAKQLRVLAHDSELEALRMLTDRRDELVRQRVQSVNRPQRLLSELVPGKAKKDITAFQAEAILAVEQLTDLFTIDKKIKASTKQLKEMVLARGSRLLDRHRRGRCGPAQGRCGPPVADRRPVVVLCRPRGDPHGIVRSGGLGDRDEVGHSVAVGPQAERVVAGDERDPAHRGVTTPDRLVGLQGGLVDGEGLHHLQGQGAPIGVPQPDDRALA
jgi:hypothetical protein